MICEIGGGSFIQIKPAIFKNKHPKPLFMKQMRAGGKVMTRFIKQLALLAFLVTHVTYLPHMRWGKPNCDFEKVTNSSNHPKQLFMK